MKIYFVYSDCGVCTVLVRFPYPQVFRIKRRR